MLPLSNILDKINLDKNKASPEFCLALVINERKVKSAIWHLEAENEEEIVFGSSESWGNENPEELIVAADASIATAITRLSYLSGKQPSKVILGLPDHWVEGNKLNQQKEKILQALCHKLLLRSLGFVVTPEAIAHYLKKEEGSSSSVILINLGETEIVVSLINQGKYLGSKIVGRSDNLALDLEEGLLRFDYEGVLPHRILLINDIESGDIEELRQVLVAYPWVGPENGRKLNFLQLPRIEIAEEGFEAKAVMIVGKQELGLLKEEKGVVPETVVEVSEIKTEEAVGLETDVQLAEEIFPEEDFGFVKNEDILLVQENKPIEEISQISEFPTLTPDESLIGEKSPVESVRKTSIFPSFSLKKILSWNFQRFKKLLSFWRIHPVVTFVPKRWLFWGAGSLALVLGILFLGFWQFAQAEVKIFVQPKRIEKEFEFSVSEKVNEVDSGKMVVPAREVTVEVSGSKTAEVRGKKTVGEKAKGEVEIINGSKKVITLPKGTFIKGPQDLRFTLDEEVRVASASIDWTADEPIKPGRSKVAVTAVDIGAQYNIAANSQFFLVSGQSEDVGIKNPSSFTGGTSREIQAVSKEDRENLQKTLLIELEEKAREELKTKLEEGDHPLSDTIILKSKTDSFNHEVGDEASSLTLEQKATFSLFYIREEDFKILADRVINNLIPSGYQKEPLKEEKESSIKDKVKGIYTARVKEEFLPEINVDTISLGLKGKTISQGEAYLQALNQIVGLEIRMKPKIFAFLGFFPLKEENIKVSVEAL